ncbi:MAG: S8 family serine peptidase [Armatimonadota bacterium]
MQRIKKHIAAKGKGIRIMGKGTRNLIRGMFTLLGAAMLMIASAGLCAPQGVSAYSQQPEYAQSRIVVKLKPGKSVSDLSGFLSRYSAKVKGNPINTQTYVVNLPSTVKANQVVDNKSFLLSKYNALGDIKFDYRVYASAVPNDTYYPDQWAIQSGQHIYAPEGWDFFNTIPGNETVVAVIDTGIRDRTETDPEDASKIVRYPHPDLVNNLLTQQGYDFGDGDEDPSPTEFSEADMGAWGHGTHVAGIIAAQSNNAKGIAGMSPNRVWILPLKIADYEGNMWSTGLIQALNYCRTQTFKSPLTDKLLKVNVINMSLGNYYDDTDVHSAIRALTSQGVVVVAASGNYNEYGLPISYPAAYDEVVAVGATDDTDSVTTFSCRGTELDIVAPGESIVSTVWFPTLATFKFEDKDTGDGGGGTGGDPPTPPGTQALIPYVPVGADEYGNAYVSWPGTSMACPHVAAAAAMLIATGVPSTDVPEVLKENATPIGGTAPNTDAGYGLLNLFKSLKNSTISVNIQTPANNSVVTLLKPKIRIDFRRADINTVRVWIDNDLVIGPSSENPSMPNWTQYYKVLDPTSGKAYLMFEWTLDANVNVHTIRATASSAIIPPAPLQPQSAEDVSRFTVKRTVLSKGWHLFAIPFWFDIPKTPETALATYSGSLYRWTYATNMFGEYAKYKWGTASGIEKNPEASFAPPSLWENESYMNPLGWSNITAPAGLGYWLWVDDPAGISAPDTDGITLDTSPYVIGLNQGWNMVGNPFSFPVSWTTIMVEYNGVRVSASEAATKGWISDFIFRWDTVLRNGAGDYARRTSKTSIMVPWEAQWVKVRVKGAQGWPAPDVKLIVPPNPYTGIVP